MVVVVGVPGNPLNHKFHNMPRGAPCQFQGGPLLAGQPM